MVWQKTKKSVKIKQKSWRLAGKRLLSKRMEIAGGLFWLAIILVVLSQKPSSTVAQKQNEVKKELFAMDTYITMTAYGGNAQAALTEAELKIKELEQLWSVTDSGSEIYAINHSEGSPVIVSGETAKLLAFSLQMADETEGALELTIYPVLTAWGFTTGENRIPDTAEITRLLQRVDYKRVQLEDNIVRMDRDMMLDLGAVGKGYAGDMAVQVLKQNEITSALLNLGGNIQTIGSKPDGSLWKLGLQNPFSDGIVGTIEIADKAVVTSGAYERYFVGEDGVRYGHIINPATGYPAQSGLASVTVIAGEGRLCDALSTSLYVMGPDKAIDYWHRHMDFDMIMIAEDGNIYLTEGIASNFNLDSNNGNMEVNIVKYNEN